MWSFYYVIVSNNFRRKKTCLNESKESLSDAVLISVENSYLHVLRVVSLARIRPFFRLVPRYSDGAAHVIHLEVCYTNSELRVVLPDHVNEIVGPFLIPFFAKLVTGIAHLVVPESKMMPFG